MRRVGGIISLVLGLAVFIAVTPVPVGERGVPYPTISKGKGDKCIRETAIMRANHMELLLHKRDETMRKGIRTKDRSLQECIACHAVPGSDGLPVSADDSRHFCVACHKYVAIKIDCFECHASRPEPGKSVQSGGRLVSKLQSVLRRPGLAEGLGVTDQ